MTPEGKVKAQVKVALNRLGCYWFMPLGTTLGRRGVPDFVGCYLGQFFAIEVKAGNAPCTGLQRMEQGAIQRHAGVVLVVRSQEEADRVGESLRRESLRWGARSKGPES